MSNPQVPVISTLDDYVGFFGIGASDAYTGSSNQFLRIAGHVLTTGEIISWPWPCGVKLYIQRFIYWTRLGPGGIVWKLTLRSRSRLETLGLLLVSPLSTEWWARDHSHVLCH